MVRLTVKVRPQRGYTYPGAIKEVTVDSSIRLEDLLANLKLTKKGTRLFSNRMQLPLNSSLATHNVQDGDTLETCSSPLLSSVLSAVISDLEAVQKLPDEERTQDRIQPLLDGCSLLDADWNMGRWSFEHVKRRSICLKMLKNLVQRSGRFADHQVPACTDLQALYDYVKSSGAFNAQAQQHNTMEQCFKPSARNRNGRPSICWELMQQKLEKFFRLVEGDDDLIEAFLTTENLRHGTTPASTPNRRAAASNRSTPRTATPRAATPRAATPRATTPNRDGASRVRTPRTPQNGRVQRVLPLSNATTESQRECASCSVAPSDCMCLEAGCPFEKMTTCFGCFRSDHPILTRNHERIMLTDQRAKAALKKEERYYCPEYASGPFSILATLYEAMHQQADGRRQLSLTEKRLKELAQPRCRANLYDRQARGRSAFACVEKLTSEDYVRKEIIPGAGEEENAKYSLLPKGEALAKFCYEFEAAFQAVVVQNPNSIRDRREALGPSVDNTISLVIDTREDKTFAERLVDRCNRDNIEYSRRDLPAGDYLYLSKPNDEEMVLPLVVERKTWSDLADSVTGKGRRRLDCVKLNGGTCDSRCQLCRMKRSRCARIMFIVEGARCVSRDGQETKCTAEKRCRYCKELQERHGHQIHQAALEDVIYRLQVDHQCLVHFTRGYNETIDSLLTIRSILRATCGTGLQVDDNLSRAIEFSIGERDLSLKLTYRQFCSNARSVTEFEGSALPPRGKIVEWSDRVFSKCVFDGKAGEQMKVTFKGPQTDSSTRASARRGRETVSTVDGSSPRKIINLDERSSNPTSALSRRRSQAVSTVDVSSARKVINLDDSSSDSGSSVNNMGKSQDSIEILEVDGWTPAKLNAVPESKDAVEIIEHLSAPARPLHTPRAKRKRGINRNDSSSRKARKAQSTPEHATGAHRVRRLDADAKPLLVMAGMYEYDQEYFSDANKIWKNLYGEKRTESAIAFTRFVKTQLRQVQEGDSPFVEREAIRFWVLFLQLWYGVVLHASRQTSCSVDLKALWSGDRQPRSDPVTAASTRAPSPPSDKGCVICYKSLRGDNAEALPCGHCFHSACVRCWWASSGKRQCPTCNYIVGAPKDDGAPQPRAKQTPQPRRARNSPSLPPASLDSRLREARLRRFENRTDCLSGLPSRPPRIAGAQRNSSSWSCGQCTYVNESSSSICVMCGDDAIGVAGLPTSVRSVATVADVEPAHWICSVCTLENADLSRPTCDACGSGNPFLIEEPAERVSRPASCTPPQSRPEKPSSTPTTGRKGKCGACHGVGHNRGNYTAQTCPMYNDAAEIEFRRKKKETEERKGHEAQRLIEQLQSATANGDRQIQEAQRLLNEAQRNREIQASVTQNELKRLQKQKARAQKRAQRLG